MRCGFFLPSHSFNTYTQTVQTVCGGSIGNAKDKQQRNTRQKARKERKKVCFPYLFFSSFLALFSSFCVAKKEEAKNTQSS